MASGGGGSAKISTGPNKGKVMYLAENEIIALGKKAGIGYAAAFAAMKSGDNAKVNALLAKVAASGTKNVKDSLGDTLAANQAAAQQGASTAASFNEQLAGTPFAVSYDAKSKTYTVTGETGKTEPLDEATVNSVVSGLAAIESSKKAKAQELQNKLDPSLQKMGYSVTANDDGTYTLNDNVGAVFTGSETQLPAYISGVNENLAPKPTVASVKANAMAAALNYKMAPALKDQGYTVKGNQDGTMTLTDGNGNTIETGTVTKMNKAIQGLNDKAAASPFADYQAAQGKKSFEQLKADSQANDLTSQLAPGLQNSGYKVATVDLGGGITTYSLLDSDGNEIATGSPNTIKKNVEYLNKSFTPANVKGGTPTSSQLNSQIHPDFKEDWSVEQNDNGSFSVKYKGGAVATGSADVVQSYMTNLGLDKPGVPNPFAKPAASQVPPQTAQLNNEIGPNLKNAGVQVQGNQDGTYTLYDDNDNILKGDAAAISSKIAQLNKVFDAAPGAAAPKAPAGPPVPGAVSYKNKYGKPVEAEGQLQGDLASVSTPFGEAVIHAPSGKAIAYVKKGDGAATMQQLNDADVDWNFDNYEALGDDQKLAVYNAVQNTKAAGNKVSVPDYALTGSFDPKAVIGAPGAATVKGTPAPKAPSAPFTGKMGTPAQAKALASAQAQAKKASASTDYQSGALAVVEKAMVEAFQGANGTSIDYTANSALSDYQGSGYIATNKKLWNGNVTASGGLTGSTVSHKALMAHMANSVSPFAMNTLKTTTQYHEAYTQFATMNVGDTYHQKGFESTTLNPHGVKGNVPDGLWVTYKIPAGSKGVYLNGVPGYSSSIPSEQEWLLPANAKWIMTSKKVHANGKIEAVMELVEQLDFGGGVIWP